MASLREARARGRAQLPAIRAALKNIFTFLLNFLCYHADEKNMAAEAQVLGKARGTGSPSRFRRPQTVLPSPASPARLAFGQRDGAAGPARPIASSAARRTTFSRRFRGPRCGGPGWGGDFQVRRPAAVVGGPFFISAVRRTTFPTHFRCLPCGGDDFRFKFELRRAAEMVLASIFSSSARQERILRPRPRSWALPGGKAVPESQFFTPFTDAYPR